jgi:hypothetical protein
MLLFFFYRIEEIFPFNRHFVCPVLFIGIGWEEEDKKKQQQQMIMKNKSNRNTVIWFFFIKKTTWRKKNTFSP